MKTKAKRYGLCLTALLLLVAVLFCPAAFAVNDFDTVKSCSLTIQYPCSGAEFRAFLVVERDTAGHYAATPDFAGYEVNWNFDEELSSTDCDAIADTLAAYAARDGVKPTATAVTDNSGTAKFTDLQQGIYLITGAVQEKDGKRYTPQNALISLPGRNENGDLIYDVAAKPKYETVDVPTKKITITALKVWQDNEAADRPDSVMVQLLKNGSVVDEVVLNQSNSWRCSWGTLDSSALWQVVEKTVPAGYSVQIDRSENHYTITNTRTDSPTEPTHVSGKLPQTGQLWWPVPLLAGAGILLYVYGWLRRR